MGFLFSEFHYLNFHHITRWNNTFENAEEFVSKMRGSMEKKACVYLSLYAFIVMMSNLKKSVSFNLIQIFYVLLNLDCKMFLIINLYPKFCHFLSNMISVPTDF